ncbi:MAG: hypothetical protein LQ340_003873 [Diploschistes diacapsis]|nr:MAG: hypothetical protein LQ340_003873 [Diploschistes diacapsis]
MFQCIHTLRLPKLIKLQDITLITPHSSAKAIEAALSQNPHLTSLPLPKANILSPGSLVQTSGTAEILRIPEVRELIRGDFVVLPCDLVSELAGESLLEAWMVKQAGIGGVPSMGYRGSGTYSRGKADSQNGGLGVWYETKGEGSTKREETDFIITAPLKDTKEPTPEGSLLPHVHQLVYSTTTDTLKDILEENEAFPLRQSVAAKHPRTRILTTYRDAHVYLFPHWVLDMVIKNETMESMSEDILGWWSKAGWQTGLSKKLGLHEVFQHENSSSEELQHGSAIDHDMDIMSISTTRKCDHRRHSTTRSFSGSEKSLQLSSIPPLLAYIHPRDPQAPLIRRVDTAALLLFISLRLAKLESIEDIGKPAASPFAHSSKIAYPAGVAPKTTINKTDCLLADNVTIESRSIIKESVIGANCHVKAGSKVTRCVLMDGAVIGERCELTGCIIGRRAHVGKESVLVDCEVQDGNVIPDETGAKNEKFMVFEGLDGSDAEGEENQGESDMLAQ